MRLTHKTTSIIPTSTYTWCWYVHNQLQFVKLDRCEDNMTTAIFCSYKLYMREGDKEEGWESGRMREEREVETRYGKSKRGKVRLGGTRSGRGRDGQRQREGKREGEIERAMKRERVNPPMSRASTSVSVLSGGTLRVTEIVSVDREPSVVVSPSARVSSAVFAVHASSFAWSRRVADITPLSHSSHTYYAPIVYPRYIHLSSWLSQSSYIFFLSNIFSVCIWPSSPIKTHETFLIHSLLH